MQSKDVSPISLDVLNVSLHYRVKYPAFFTHSGQCLILCATVYYLVCVSSVSTNTSLEQF